MGGHARAITIVERDGPPPNVAAHDALDEWQRHGAGQFRHSHVFLGQLTTIIRSRYPALMEELLAAGARLRTFEDGLPRHLRGHYRARPGDGDLTSLLVRRATFEYVLRKHVERLPSVTVRCGATVRGLVARRENGMLVARGLHVESGGAMREFTADVIVDANGRMTHFPDWLRAEGVALAEESHPARITYFTRHYRLRDGAAEPHDTVPDAGDLGFLRYDVCRADNRNFSITLVMPDIERDLRRAARDPETFDSIARAIPACARWLALAEPASPVHAMGNLVSVWRSQIVGGRPQVLNFFAVGDAAIRSNPLYGRGCSAGFLHAHVLRDTIESVRDPASRALVFEQRTRASLERHYKAMIRQDAAAIARAEALHRAPARPRMLPRLRSSLADDGIVPAMRGDIAVLRAMARSVHMMDAPVSWAMRPLLLARVLKMWAIPRGRKRALGLYPPPPGPSRAAMLEHIGL